MGSNWKHSTLGELLNSGKAFLQTGPFGTALKANEYTATGVPLISVREIREGYFQIEEATPRVDQSVLSRLPKFVLKTGDIVFARKGGIERNALITETENGWFLGSDGIFLRFTDDNDSRFFSYVMRSPSVKAWLIKNCEGTTMPSLNQKILSRLPVYVPLLEEQMKVADWLEALDNKITLNRQINQTLEQMAQALFKSWFVDFDPVVDNALDAGFFEQDLAFPDELLRRVVARRAVREQSDLKPLPDAIRQLFPAAFEECAEPSVGLGGWVPKGWIVSTTGDELTVKGGSTPSTANPEFWEGGHIHWTSPKDLSGNQEKVMLDTERRITDAGLNKITSGLLPIETVLMSSRAPIGYLTLTKIPLTINQGYIAIPATKRLSQEYVLYWLNSSMDEIKGIAGGTTFAEISKKTFNSISIIVPSKETIEMFSALTKSYLNKMTLNVVERTTLENLRDTLLPKLISGELRLDDIEADLSKEEVT